MNLQLKKMVKEELQLIKEEPSLPSDVKRFSRRFIDALQGANLNRMKQVLVLTQVIDALGIEPRKLAQMVARVKKGLD